MSNRFRGISVDSSAVYKSLKDLPYYVGAQAVGQAVGYAMRPEVSKVKMQIGVAMSGKVISKGIKDYQRAVAVKIKVRKNKGYAVGQVGAERGVIAASSHRRGKATVWSRLAHLFEFGTKRGIEAMPSVGVVAQRDRVVILDRYRGFLGTAIMGQVKKYEHNQARKAAK